MNSENKTITLTFGDVGENHVGMEKIGKLAEDGYTLKDLKKFQKFFKDNNCETELVFLHKELKGITKISDNKAYLLKVKNGVDCLLAESEKNSNDIFKEQTLLEPDKKAFMYGRVVNKIARYNLCFGNKSQKAEYEKGKGTIIAFNKVPLTNHIKNKLEELDSRQQFICEGNYYYDVDKCYISEHGDSERRKVIGIRLGESFPLFYQWYYQGKPVGNRLKFIFNSGDIYFMSAKAVGYDWKSKSKYTLRHAAGLEKNIKKNKFSN